MIPVLITGWNMAKAGFALVSLKAWIGVGLVLGLMYFAHWEHAKGEHDAEVRIAAAEAAERSKVQANDASAVAAANRAAEAAAAVAAQREKELQDAQDEVRKLKDAGSICLPAAVTGSLRNIR